MNLLGYNRWENFDKAVCRAMESCKTSEIEVSNHFREVKADKEKLKITCLLVMLVRCER